MENSELQYKIHKNELNIQGESYFSSIVVKYIYKKFKKYIKMPLLDAGSGDGSLIKFLHKKFPKIKKDIYGIDLVGRPNLNIIEGDLKDTRFNTKQFKTITCVEVIEHLDDATLDGALKEFYRILDDEGVVIITFPFDEDFSKRSFTCPHCDKTFHKYGHMRSFHSKKEIYDLFEKYNFSIDYFDILPLGAIAKVPMLRILKPLLNKLNNPSGFHKRTVVVLKKHTIVI